MNKITIVVLTMLLCTTPVFAAQPDTIISQEDLMHMSNDQRNAVFAGMKQAQDSKQSKPSLQLDDKTTQALANIDVETFKSKLLAIADTLVIFFDKLGVSVNTFITTPVGIMTALCIVYKVGVFQGVGSFFIGICLVALLTVAIIKLNTKTTVKKHTYDKAGNIVSSEDFFIPKLTAICSTDKSEYAMYSAVSSIICVILIVICVANFF